MFLVIFVASSNSERSLSRHCFGMSTTEILFASSRDGASHNWRQFPQFRGNKCAPQLWELRWSLLNSFKAMGLKTLPAAAKLLEMWVRQVLV
jgi:hypothetical protein